MGVCHRTLNAVHKWARPNGFPFAEASQNSIFPCNDSNLHVSEPSCYKRHPTAKLSMGHSLSTTTVTVTTTRDLDRRPFGKGTDARASHYFQPATDRVLVVTNDNEEGFFAAGLSQAIEQPSIVKLISATWTRNASDCASWGPTHQSEGSPAKRGNDEALNAPTPFPVPTKLAEVQ